MARAIFMKNRSGILTFNYELCGATRFRRVVPSDAREVAGVLVIHTFDRQDRAPFVSGNYQFILMGTVHKNFPVLDPRK